MTFFSEKYQNFMRYPFERRLGNLAVNFNRIAEYATQTDKALYFIQETKYLTDWCAIDSALETQLELQAAQRKLSKWSNHWEEISQTPEKTIQAQTEARAISQRLLEIAGLT